MHSLKKLIGLVALYTIIIVGIFVIQFSSDSVIRKNFRGIRVTLAQSENENGKKDLKNNFQVSYSGVLFLADENSPVTYLQEGTTHATKLISFEEKGDSACTLSFENNIKLSFSLNGDEQNPIFSINAEMPENVESLNLNYTLNSGYFINEKKTKSIILSGKKSNSELYSLAAPALTETVLTLQNGMNSAHYTVVVEKNGYSLDDIETLAMASKDMYTATLKAFGTALVTEFISSSESDASFASSLNEQTVVSFLSEMAYEGRYNEGINTVPTQFVNSNRRTFLSSPFLGGMAAQMPTLTMQVQNFNNMIARAVQEQMLDIFTVQNIAPYMYTQGNRGYVAQLVRMPASLTELNLTVENAAGIIRSYIYFKEQGSSMAGPLEPVLELCAAKIAESAAFEGEKLLLKDEGGTLSSYTMAMAGDALISYGQQFEESKLEHLGYLIVNSCAGEADSLDLRTLGELYPILMHTNKYYPHFELLRTMEARNIWAYTVSPDIGYARDENLTISLDIDFPVGLSHFVFISGLTPFQRIQIYNMDFRTDARFETYNSSGYIYRTDAQTLLLKSRHRDRHEIVRLFYRSVAPAVEPAVEALSEE